MVRGASRLIRLEEKSRNKLKVVAIGEKNGKKRVMQVLDLKTRDVGL